MAIRMRRGASADLDTARLQSGEIAVATNPDKVVVKTPGETILTLATTNDLALKVDTSSVGANNGIATLDSSGKVPSSQLPSYVDDVIEGYLYEGSFYEDAQHTELITPESSKIYVDLSTDKTYRWGGAVYVDVTGASAWGEIRGTLSNQTDLLNALNAKQDTLTLPLSTANGGTGNANGYIRTGQKNDTTIGHYATAEGYNTTASGLSSHAEGEESIASAAMSHAEGVYTTASGRQSHAEGHTSSATGDYAHAEGQLSTASGNGSHAEGYRTVASGSYSHAEGEATEAGYSRQHVQGIYNENKSNTLFEIGNGENVSGIVKRRNAFEVYKDGHINVNGDIYKNGESYIKVQNETLIIV